MKNRDFLLAIVFITIGFIYRILPLHLPNLTPIAAMALVGGMYMNKKGLAFLVPVAALFLSDFILNNFLFRSAFAGQSGFVFWADYMYFTYGAMLIAVMIGMVLSKKSVGSKIIGGSIFSSIVFYLFADFGSWISLPLLYPKNIGGLLSAYVAGFPFFLMSLMGTLIFSVIFIGSIEYMKQGKVSALDKELV